MVSPDDKIFLQTSSIHSFLSDGFHNHRPHLHSHWLQANLSEMEGKVKVMLNIIEDQNGDSFAERAEMYFKRRPHLLVLLDELHRSYLCLAEKYYQICRSHSARLTHPSNIIQTCSSSKSSENLPEIDSSSNIASHYETLPTDNIPQVDVDEYVMQQFVSMDQLPLKSNAKENLLEIPQTTMFERETRSSSVDDSLTMEGKNVMVWSEKEVSELMEEHLKHQAELVKRNEEKRMKIKELRSQLKDVMAENQALVKACSNPKPKGTLFQFAKLTGCSR